MPRILIGDDDLATCALLTRVLHDAGYSVETAPDSTTALAMVADSPPDLLITDVVMPGLTGWSVFSRARRLSPTLPISSS
jgi:CheY-like chemotaxis protein